MHSKKTRFCQVALAAISLLSLTAGPAIAQVAGANQTIYHDEQEMLNTDQAMINQYASAENEAESKLAAEQAKTNAYRLYAEQRIQALESQKKGVSPSLAGAKSGEMAVLTSWLQQDSAYRAKQQAYIDQLEQCISNLRTSQTNTLANLNTDINALRQGVQDDKDQQKFQNQMQMNQFNELKSEMGACSWGDTPRDGTYNSVGGYGFNGGYGYSAMGGRRWLGGGRGY